MQILDLVQTISTIDEQLQLVSISCCTVPRKIRISQYKFSTQHSFAGVHYGCYSQDSLRCEQYTVALAISHLVIIMKSDHH